MKDQVHAVIDGVIDVWIWITLGLLGLLGFFGKRMLKRWDAIAESHVPSVEIEKKFNQVYADMTKCQKDLKDQQDKILENVGEVHSRIDDIYTVIATGAAPRKHRKRTDHED